jgi:pyrroline-5-carboxylate reductase
MLQGTLGFVGFGNMARAIFDGLWHAGIVRPESTVVYDLRPEACNGPADDGATVARSAGELAEQCDVVVLATKPQDMDSAVEAIAGTLRNDALVISIAAGLSIQYFESRLPAGAHVIRVMPNTPALVRAGASGIALGAACTDADRETALAMFNAIGKAVIVDETQLDAVTALSGSGPAYYFYFAECFIDAAKALGLHEDQATELAVQTLYGAGKLLAESGETARTLRERVTSKGGTTAAALDAMRDRDVNEILQAAMNAAARRSEELGR